MNYCSHCGSPNLRFDVPIGDNRERFICNQCESIHYVNPRVIVGILATWENKVLICRRNIEPRKNLWNLPAGFMENGETAEQGALREAFEEARAQVTIDKLHCIFSVPTVNQVYMIFKGQLKDLELSCTPETSEIRLVEHSEVPWHEIAFSSSQFALEQYFAKPDFLGVHLGSVVEAPY